MFKRTPTVGIKAVDCAHANIQGLAVHLVRNAVPMLNPRVEKENKPRSLPWNLQHAGTQSVFLGHMVWKFQTLSTNVNKLPNLRVLLVNSLHDRLRLRHDKRREVADTSTSE